MVPHFVGGAVLDHARPAEAGFVPLAGDLLQDRIAGILGPVDAVGRRGVPDAADRVVRVAAVVPHLVGRAVLDHGGPIRILFVPTAGSAGFQDRVARVDIPFDTIGGGSVTGLPGAGGSAPGVPHLVRGAIFDHGNLAAVSAVPLAGFPGLQDRVAGVFTPVHPVRRFGIPQGISPAVEAETSPLVPHLVLACARDDHGYTDA